LFVRDMLAALGGFSMSRRPYVTIVVLIFGLVTFHGNGQKAKARDAEPTNSCTGGGQITIPIPNATSVMGTFHLVYMGSDNAIYRITPLIESSSQGSTITAAVAINGNHANVSLITFDAFQNGAGLSSVDVQGQRVEIELSNVGTSYDDSIATFCYFPLKYEPINPPSPVRAGQVSTLKGH
jgi:hypothetical protein